MLFKFKRILTYTLSKSLAVFQWAAAFLWKVICYLRLLYELVLFFMLKLAPSKFWFCQYTIARTLTFFHVKLDREKLLFFKAQQPFETFNFDLFKACPNLIWEIKFQGKAYGSLKSSILAKLKELDNEILSTIALKFCYSRTGDLIWVLRASLVLKNLFHLVWFIFAIFFTWLFHPLVATIFAAIE